MWACSMSRWSFETSCFASAKSACARAWDSGDMRGLTWKRECPSRVCSSDTRARLKERGRLVLGLLSQLASSATSSAKYSWSSFATGGCVAMSSAAQRIIFSWIPCWGGSASGVNSSGGTTTVGCLRFMLLANSFLSWLRPLGLRRKPRPLVMICWKCAMASGPPMRSTIAAKFTK